MIVLGHRHGLGVRLERGGEDINITVIIKFATIKRRKLDSHGSLRPFESYLYDSRIKPKPSITTILLLFFYRCSDAEEVGDITADKLLPIVMSPTPFCFSGSVTAIQSNIQIFERMVFALPTKNPNTIERSTP